MQIIIVDDHPIFRNGLKFLIESSFDSNVITVKEFSNGIETLAYAKLNPSISIAILDIDMPGMSGLDVSRELRAINAAIKVIILTMHRDVELLKLAISYGVNGYLIKDNTSDELLTCLQKVLAGENYYCKSMNQFSSEKFIHNEEKQEVIDNLQLLTKTELKTLKLVSQKLSSKEIADLMFVSVKSVENYRSRICKKLQLDARNNSLLMWVLEYKSFLEMVEEF